ncbi:protein involved in gliding motility GldH [Lutibacter sp. Hel_I_33_5]|uniref:gliding motility lipoprotein GldH n=1 Tax=Lutibacter sp. Hel_I_33_5 TaxID=1566289 RepID=UPI0011A916D5|nr:gliding motility lipoprotein GldH [Lutibacter sp. Hel_I_33_5]TVZ56230.1 protein involved in gliding motility GldH [Lutibacter sp. Hel_I_33_5]
MEIINKASSLGITLLLVVGFVSCDSKAVFDRYISLENAVWKNNKPAEFQFTISDTISKHNLFINLRNNNDYEFSNLYLITTLNLPDNTKIIDTLEYEMADASGQFLGNGFTEIKENKLFYKEQKVFQNSGEYSVEISQAMRKNGAVNSLENLLGISDVGFRIEKN